MNRPTFAEIDLAALRHNFATIRHLSDNTDKILAIVKANAYGHGAVRVSRELEKSGVDFLGVAMCEEAVELRNAGIKTPIMIMGGIYHDQADDVIKNKLIPVVFDINTALHLNAIASQNSLTIKVHIKIDTGMGRIGVAPSAITGFFKKLQECKNIVVDGLLTHLAVADISNPSSDSYTSKQIETFLNLADTVKSLGYNPAYLHLANSAAIIRKLTPPFNLARPGLMLYGINPAPQVPIDLKPVLSLKSKIIALKNVPKGYSISYRRTFISERESIIATLPIGYADGYNRQFSNKAMVIIHGRRAPVVGVVCMDMVMIDVTDVPGVKLYDDVTLIGSQGQDSINASELAAIAQSIPYEILCSISSRVPRVYAN